MIQKLKNILKKPNQLILDSKEALHFGKDWTKEFASNPGPICFPESTEEVSQILALASAHTYPVVPSGGRTGLAAGATATNKELVLSLERMNQILNLDKKALTIEVQAGVKTQEVQIAAKEVGLFFPLDLASKGTCQIGGNCATNAGGLKFIRYKGMREQVLGLEVVLASGQVLDMNHSLRKNNTGYDLKQLFIGSEGTLGVITKVTLGLVSQPKNLGLLFLGVGAFEDVLHILDACYQRKLSLTAFEVFSQKAFQYVRRYQPSKKNPLSLEYPFYTMIEVEYEETDPLFAFFETLWEKGLIQDGTKGDSSQSCRELWSWREMITESVGAFCTVRKNDISLPIGKMAQFVSELKQIYLNPLYQDLDLVIFGHLGDGNLHLNHACPKDRPQNGFFEKVGCLEKNIFERLKAHRGSISAEHGVGLIKRDDLHYTKTDLEIKMMREVKKVFDPLGILNPGKMF